MKVSFNSIAAWVRAGVNRWRLAFLAFALVYGLILIFGIPPIGGLAVMPVQWDEVGNLNAGILLLRGNLEQYAAWNNFYPPLYSVLIAGFYSVGGVGVFTGRLVSVAFSLLSMGVVFEFTLRFYGAKTALLASAFLAVIPGYVLLSRMGMIETTLLFFFTLTLASFFVWLTKHQTKFLALSIVAFALGVATKYQTVIALVVAAVALAVLGRGYLMEKFRTVPRLILAVLAVVVPLAALFYGLYSAGMLNQWLYALNIGNPDKSLYSTGVGRFPSWYDGLPSWVQVPIFYLIELAAQYPTVHPISVVLYVLGLAGLVGLALRHKTQDKYLLIWFIVVYVFFTAIPNREWRYLIPLFPVLAIAASNLVVSGLGWLQKTWRLPHLSVPKRMLMQGAACGLIAVTLVGFAFSVGDAYSISENYQVELPIGDAVSYVTSHLSEGENVMVLCPFNLMDQSIVWFYLNQNSPTPIGVYQFPAEPVDTYTPNFNMTQLINQCEANHIKYLLVDEYGGAKYHYFGTTLSFPDFNQTLMATGRFHYEPTVFWEEPGRIFVLTFS
ncbi:MAG: glycosyltransferase family 39 protein [Candidatus Bathyarchaeota archaeon]|nr:glycosyltransferase family 39 protein [Candidatus Bathyarchaeota archaeon]